jgi:hypothetical protein
MEEVQEKIPDALERRWDLLAELVSLGDSDTEAASRQPRSRSGVSRLANVRRAPSVPREESDPPDEALDVHLWTGLHGALLIERRVDADGDGSHEEIRFLDPEGGAVIRKHVDRNRDGRVDCWKVYKEGEVVARALDTNFNGRAEVWERYRGGRTIARQVDRDEDGLPDAFFHYRGDLLVEEHQDMNGDGSVDVRSIYRDGRLIRRELLDSGGEP